MHSRVLFITILFGGFLQLSEANKCMKVRHNVTQSDVIQCYNVTQFEDLLYEAASDWTDLQITNSIGSGFVVNTSQ